MFPVRTDSSASNEPVADRRCGDLGILIVTVAVLLLLLCPDTPVGKWSERGQAMQRQASITAGQGHHAHIAGTATPTRSPLDEEQIDSDTSKPSTPPTEKKKDDVEGGVSDDNEPRVGERYEIDAAQHEVILKPSWTEAMRVVLSPQTMVLGAVSSSPVLSNRQRSATILTYVS